MKKIISAVVAILVLSGQAYAQWQVPDHAVPIGRGAGATGFKSAAPSALGRCLKDTGASTDPAFKLCEVSIADYGAAADASCANAAANTTAIQAAFTAATAVYVPEGTFCTAALSIPNTLKRIRGSGPSSALKASGTITAFSAFMRATNANSLRIGDISVDVNSTTYASNGTINIVSGTNVTIDHVNIPQAGRFGVQIETCSNCTVSFANVQNYSQSAIDAINCGACNFVDSRVTAPAGVAGPATINIAVNGGNDVITSRNYSYGGQLWGIHYADVLRGTISLNNVQDSGAEGITVGATVSSGSSYVTISDNDISWGGAVGADFGLSIQGFDATHQVQYVNILNNRITNSFNPCIAIASDSVHTTIAGNKLINCVRSADVTQSGAVILDGPRVDYTTVKSNDIYSSTGTNFANGIKELPGGVDHTLIDSNTIIGQSGTDIVLVGANSKVLTNLKLTGTALLGSGVAVSDNLDLITATQGALISRTATQWIGVADPTGGLPLLGGGPAGNNSFGVLTAHAGGTGQISYTTGDTLYASAANTLSKLAGNTTTSRKFLRQTGTGSASQAPAWDTLLAADIPGSALTKSDDTNVTLTLGGSPSTALLNATSLGLGWTGQLAVSRGGTGIASGTSGGIPYFSSTSAIASSALLGANQIVLGGGAGTTPSSLGTLGTTTTVLHGNAAGAPTFSAVSLTADVTGTLPIAKGGTGDTGTAWTTYTPTLSCGTGSITSQAGTTGSYKTLGKTTFVSISALVATNNTCASNLRATLPSTAQSGMGMAGQNISDGAAVMGSISASSNLLVMFKSDGTGYPISGNAQTINIGGVYESQ